MLEMIPTLMAADNQDALTEIVKSQTETQWENFFNAINNSDLRDAFLLTQNLPPITPRRLIPSIVDLVSKCIKVNK